MTAMFGNSLFHLESDNKFLLRLGAGFLNGYEIYPMFGLNYIQIKEIYLVDVCLKILPPRLNVRQIYYLA